VENPKNKSQYPSKQKKTDPPAGGVKKSLNKNKINKN
jgi:hypothetical protein